MADHDHGSGSGSGSGNGTEDSGMSMMMTMYFYASEHATILFKEWHTMTWAEMLGSCIAVMVLSFLYEGLKVGRELLDERMMSRSSMAVDIEDRCECVIRDNQSGTTDNSKRSSSVIVIDGKTSSGKGQWRSHPICQFSHFIQTILHFIQLWLSLCVMLIFMTFNIYLCLAITVGGALGYFSFAWAYKRRPIRSSDVCH